MQPRRHLVPGLLAVLAALLGGVLWFWTTASAADGVGLEPVATAAHASPPAPSCSLPAPRTAAGYQAMFDAKHDETWAGGDQAASVALPDGRTLWMFGDSIRGGVLPGGARAAGSRFVHNAMLIQTGGCLTAVPAPAEVIPSRADGQWYWPESAVVVGDELVVLCLRVERTGADVFGFRTTGVDAAVLSLRGPVPTFERIVATPSSTAAEGSVQYGTAVVQAGDWLYVYGSRRPPRAFGRTVMVARVRPAALLHPEAWQFWAGGQWSSQQRRATQVADRWATAFSVWQAPDGTLRSLTKEDDVFGRTVVTGRSSSPTSAFSRRAVLDAPSFRRPGELLYSALAHPEIRLADGRLLVTVCRNSTDLARVWADADLYKPQFSAVPRD
jgi:hypothetical protein